MMRHIFDESLRAWVTAETNRPVGLAELPEDNPNIPYAVMTPINSPRGEGSWQFPEEERDMVYQYICVGKTPAQAGWMSDRINEVLIGRDEAGYTHNANTVQGATVLWRLSDSLGSIVKTGDRLFQVIDTYRIRVTQ